MTREEAAVRAERLRLVMEITGYGTVPLDRAVFDEGCDRLTADEDQILYDCDRQDAALALAVKQADADVMALRWHALEELLAYLRSDECPRDTWAGLETKDAHYFLQLMEASGWWAPPTHLDDGEEDD